MTHATGQFAAETACAGWLLDETGQDVVEYGLLIATIAIVVLMGVSVLGSGMNAWLHFLAGRITTTGTA